MLTFFQDLYRVLLEAESEGILDDVDMTKVEKLILDPKAEMKPLGRSRVPRNLHDDGHVEANTPDINITFNKKKIQTNKFRLDLS